METITLIFEGIWHNPIFYREVIHYSPAKAFELRAVLDIHEYDALVEESDIFYTNRKRLDLFKKLVEIFFKGSDLLDGESQLKSYMWRCFQSLVPSKLPKDLQLPLAHIIVNFIADDNDISYLKSSDLTPIAKTNLVQRAAEQAMQTARHFTDRCDRAREW
ncbi:MAG: hypothetical protein AMJ84_09715 [Acidithiobacillales bacterium SM23_46]|nr:MAG: hypothetical protein AMJ84_09715 [Acidithiobacillales bacterium SM23_46]